MESVLDFRKPHVLRNKKEYEAAVAEIDELLDRDPTAGTEAFERLHFLSVLVEAYEEDLFPIEQSSPQEIVEFMLEQTSTGRGELAAALGGRSRVSEFFSGKRGLSISQANALKQLLGIPLDLLLSTPTGTGDSHAG